MHRADIIQSHISRPRAVLISGTRTPFARLHSEMMEFDTVALGAATITGLLKAAKLDPKEIHHVVWGSVIGQSNARNVAKEVCFDAKLPDSVAAHTVSMQCASGMAAIISAAQIIGDGAADVVLAGGGDSASCIELPLERRVAQSLALFNQGKIGVYGLISKAGMPWTWLPKGPSPTERTTGKTMGYHADEMSEIHGVSRKEQDDFAMASHRKASEAIASGLLREEIVPIGRITKDTLVRAKQDPQKVASLPPVFRPAAKGGTITAANATPLTDGASCVLIMSEHKAKALGYPTDVSIRSYSYTGIAPVPNHLLAPAHGWYIALERAKLKLSDIDYFEIHEAFAGQVLATLKCLASEELSRKWLGRSALGSVPPEKINIYGGSLAFGHPFAATGGRVATNAARILRTKKAKYVLASLCAAGGLGVVIIFERIET